MRTTGLTLDLTVHWILNNVTLSSANTLKILYPFIKCFVILQASTIHANNVGDINIETGLGYYANIYIY